LEEEITFYGHKNILSLHPRTIEVTKDPNLTKNGDCIIGVSANKACDDLNISVKKKLSTNNTFVKMKIIVDQVEFELAGIGNTDLSISHKHDIVLRKSDYADSRTLAISCDKSAIDIPRHLVNLLTVPDARGILRITIE
jgi:uncharacterized protein